ncbi:hypothetical protein D0U01_33720, partial [Burkholderia pseudomallei]
MPAQPGSASPARAACRPFGPAKNCDIVQISKRPAPTASRTVFDILYALTPDQRRRAIAERGAAVQAVLTNGTTGLFAEEIAC